jgi:hypothetical protein
MLTRASFRVKTMFLFYTSTGIRKSALIDLRLKHLKKIDSYGLYIIHLIFLTLVITYYVQSADALSPSFVRQEVDHNPNDISPLVSNQTECSHT